MEISYSLPFATSPSLAFYSTNPLVSNSIFLSLHPLRNCLHGGGGSGRTTGKPAMCRGPLGVVPEKNGSFRLILDLHYLNTFLADQKLRQDNFRPIPLFENDFEMSTFHLRGGYYNFHIAAKNGCFLILSWSFGASQNAFQFACFSFG